MVGNFKANDKQLKELAKTVGERLAGAFKSIENGIRLVSDNIDIIVKSFKIFIGLKLANFIIGIGAQFAQLTILIKASTAAMYGFNVAVRANLIGLIITSIQVAVVAVIAFHDELKALGKYLMGNFNDNLNKIKINFLKFKNVLNIGDEDVNLEAIKELQRELDGTADKWRALADAQEAYRTGKGPLSRADRFKDFKGADPRGDMAREDNIAAIKAKEKLMALDNRIFQMNKDFIRDQAKLNAAQETYGSLLKDAGIEAKLISNTISTTLLDGMRQNLSVLENIKNIFRNVYQTVLDTIISKTIELQIEKLFEKLGEKKVQNQKEITNEYAKQLGLATATAAVNSASSGNSLFGFLGFNKGGMVPGGAPYTDRVPAMLTPGEVVIPRGQVGQQGSVTNNTINISGNVDQRAIDQIRSVISSSPSHVGGANKTFSRNTSGLSMRRK